MLWSQGTLENVKPPCPLPGRAEISQDKWDKTRMLWKPPFSGWRTWTTPFWISLPWVLPAACPTSHFQERCFLGSRWNSSREWWPPDQLTQAGSPTVTPMLVSLWKSSPSSLTQSFQNPAAFEPPLWFQGFCLKLLCSPRPEKAMALHSSTLAWKIPWTEEPGRLQSKGSLGVGHDWATSLSLFTFMHWGRKWQPTPVFLPGESQVPGSLVGCHLWGRTESDTTEAT